MTEVRSTVEAPKALRVRMPSKIKETSDPKLSNVKRILAGDKFSPTVEGKAIVGTREANVKVFTQDDDQGNIADKGFWEGRQLDAKVLVYHSDYGYFAIPNARNFSEIAFIDKLSRLPGSNIDRKTTQFADAQKALVTNNNAKDQAPIIDISRFRGQNSEQDVLEMVKDAGISYEAEEKAKTAKPVEEKDKNKKPIEKKLPFSEVKTAQDLIATLNDWRNPLELYGLSPLATPDDIRQASASLQAELRKNLNDMSVVARRVGESRGVVNAQQAYKELEDGQNQPSADQESDTVPQGKILLDKMRQVDPLVFLGTPGADQLTVNSRVGMLGGTRNGKLTGELQEIEGIALKLVTEHGATLTNLQNSPLEVRRQKIGEIVDSIKLRNNTQEVRTLPRAA